MASVVVPYFLAMVPTSSPASTVCRVWFGGSVAVGDGVGDTRGVAVGAEM